MAASIIPSLTRVPSAALTRRLWSWTQMFSPVKRIKIEASLILEGFEASELKTLLPLLQQHLSAAQAKKVVNKYVVPHPNRHTQRRMGAKTSVTVQGFEGSELEDLYTWADQHTHVTVDKERGGYTETFIPFFK
ncbi:hypothetical protein L1987_82309 [Smallanthus sonchifolius]|uniref:Uncharacterized protein n=1 Tax=Smallanthus sonchifolius TaxID=185202 RepID=A0ACB8YAG9_9ASTR|nr:hypothetical protein L1987_82309 [Smallanthus sonchifolius]